MCRAATKKYIFCMFASSLCLVSCAGGVNSGTWMRDECMGGCRLRAGTIESGEIWSSKDIHGVLRAFGPPDECTPVTMWPNYTQRNGVGVFLERRATPEVGIADDSHLFFFYKYNNSIAGQPSLASGIFIDFYGNGEIKGVGYSEGINRIPKSGMTPVP